MNNFAAISHDGFLLLLRQNDAIAKKILSGGRWEPDVTTFLKYFCKPGLACLDIGANFGYHSMMMSRLVGQSGRVFAFEPQTFMHTQLCANIFVNDIRNITPLSYAAMNVSGQFLEMDQIDYDQDSINPGCISVGRGGNKCLGMAVDDLRFERVDIVKIDIQGTELLALRGMEKTISKFRPVMIVEIEELCLRRFGTSSIELMNHLLSMDYSLVRVMNDYPCDHIALPNERIHEMEDLRKAFNARTELITGAKVTELVFNPAMPYSNMVYSYAVLAQ